MLPVLLALLSGSLFPSSRDLMVFQVSLTAALREHGPDANNLETEARIRPDVISITAGETPHRVPRMLQDRKPHLPSDDQVVPPVLVAVELLLPTGQGFLEDQLAHDLLVV